MTDAREGDDNATPSGDAVDVTPHASGGGRHRRGAHAAAVAVQDVDAAGDTAADSAKPTSKRKGLTFWQELPILVLVAVVLAVLIKTFAFQAFYIPTESMETTVNTGDRVMTNKVVYWFGEPARGEVVVFDGTDLWDGGITHVNEPTNPVAKAVRGVGQLIGFVPSGTDYIKRVIGLPGETVACCDAEGRVTVNGVGLDESEYVVGETTPFLPVTVPDGHLFVMGDNRARSSDSRANGPIPADRVLGRAAFVMWPRDHWRGLPVPQAIADAEIPSNDDYRRDIGSDPDRDIGDSVDPALEPAD